MGMRADELASIRLVVNSFLQDSATNSRTGLTTTCDVGAPSATTRIKSMPMFAHLERFLLTLPDDTDVQAGDTLTVTGEAAGVYTALVVQGPETLSTDLAVHCVLGERAYFPQTLVTFRSHNAPDTQFVTATIQIQDYEPPQIVLNAGDTPTYRWSGLFPKTLTYPNGKNPGVNDRLEWPAEFGANSDTTPRFVTIFKPRAVYGFGTMLEFEFNEPA